MILVFTTFNNKLDAVKVGKNLLKQKLIACYNLFPIESAYWWKGKIVDDKEFLMILKTNDSNFSKVEEFIKDHHPNETPEILSLQVKSVSNKYLKWLNTEVK